VSLKHAILVLLENKPGSGYDLYQRFRSGIGNFWHASHQQVYQELKKLHAQKLVEYTLKTQREKPDKKVYRITRAGHRALQAWFRTPVKPPRLKEALLVKVFGGRLRDPADVVAELDQHLAVHRRTLEGYREMEKGYFAQDEAARRAYRMPYLTLRSGIRYEHTWIESLEEVRELLLADGLPEAPVPELAARRG
jgi:PadR family transcriptional regulator AphA